SDHRDLGAGLDLPVTTGDGDAIGSELDVVAIGAHACGLEAGRPGAGFLEITDVAELPPVVASRVGSPASDSGTIVPAPAATRVGHHHSVGDVAQQCDLWRREVHTPEVANDGTFGGDTATAGCLGHPRWILHHQLARGALLQQQFVGTHQCLRVEALLPGAI